MKLQIRNNILFLFIQAYAELETDTPGQILGVTSKNDGKSKSSTNSTENISKKFTQGPKENEKYKKHDETGTEDYEEEVKTTEKNYSFLGFFIIVALGIYYMFGGSWDHFGESREQALEYSKQQQKKNYTVYDDA